MKAFTWATGARPAEAANLGVPLGGTVSAFMAKPHLKVVPSIDKLVYHIDLLYLDTGMDPNEVYGLMGGSAQTAAPPTPSKNLVGKLTYNIKTDLQTAMALFRMSVTAKTLPE